MTAGMVLAILVVAVLALAACYTVPTPEEIPTDLDQADFFQRAQSAIDASRWDEALVYYHTFLDRFPDDEASRIAARYEIGFIYYRQGDYELARTELEAVLANYETEEIEEISHLPLWPQILARKVLTTIDERLEQQPADV